MIVDVRPGQLWEFEDGRGPARQARVLRVTEPIDGVRYVFLSRVGSGESMRTPLRRLRYQMQGARLVEDVDAGGVERHEPPTAWSPPPQAARDVAPAVTVHEPRMGAAYRREAVARAQRLHARGMAVGRIAEVLCVSVAVVRLWVEEPVAR